MIKILLFIIILLLIVNSYKNNRIKYNKIDIYIMLSKASIKFPLHLLNDPYFFKVVYIFLNSRSPYCYIGADEYIYMTNSISFEIRTFNSGNYREESIRFKGYKIIFIKHYNKVTLYII